MKDKLPTFYVSASCYFKTLLFAEKNEEEVDEISNTLCLLSTRKNTLQLK